MGTFFKRDIPLPVTGGGARRALPAPYNAQRAMIASARTYQKSLFKNANARPKEQEWQREAWKGYDGIGEIWFGFNTLAETFSRVKVYAGALLATDEAPPPVDKVDANELPSALAADANTVVSELVSSDFASLARAFALNMSVVGECLMVEIPSKGSTQGEGKPGQWVIKSTAEVEVTADKISLKPSDGSGEGEVLSRRVRTSGAEAAWSPEISIGRIWRRHPKHSDESDSSMRAVEDPIQELLLVSKLIRTITRARLNAGILFVPDGVSIMSAAEGTKVDADGLPIGDVADANTFIQDLIDTMVSPITDEDSVTSVVPSVLTGPADLGEKIRHLTFDRSADEWLTQRADRALERILQGIAIPKDIVTGLANVKYSNGVIIDQNFWKSSVEPLALLLSDALTDIYLRPRLISMGHSPEDVERVCVWYDPSEIVTAPDQSDDATKGYEMNLLNGDAWRSAHGFGDNDAPDEDQLALQLLLSKGTLPEDVVNVLLQKALPKIMGEAREKGSEGRIPESAGDILNQNPEAPPADPA